jgi:hypothetical protein
MVNALVADTHRAARIAETRIAETRIAETRIAETQ